MMLRVERLVLQDAEEGVDRDSLVVVIRIPTRSLYCGHRISCKLTSCCYRFLFRFTLRITQWQVPLSSERIVYPSLVWVKCTQDSKDLDHFPSHRLCWLGTQYSTQDL